MERQEKLVAIRMPNTLAEKLDQISKSEDMNRSSLLRRISKAYIKNFEKNAIQQDEILVKVEQLVE